MTADNRIYSQYRKKPKAVRWLNITSDMGKQLDAVFRRIRTSYDIDSATEHELSVLEDIVVVPKLDNKVVIPVAIDTIEVRRLLIKAKIVKNNSFADYDSIIEALEFITGEENIQIIDHEDMTFEVRFDRELTDTQKHVLNNYDIVPRPQCVKFRGFGDVVESTQFGGEGTNSQFGGNDAQFGYLFGGS